MVPEDTCRGLSTLFSEMEVRGKSNLELNKSKDLLIIDSSGTVCTHFPLTKKEKKKERKLFLHTLTFHHMHTHFT